eukprot:GDKJ01054894.1.p2 GENE.GDKJ01054894.1~~GDKJ01054894.1.p2  ORF type:complete len:104 (+),score=5.36 GDKJ01054894.1:54-365(+)
MNQKIFSDYDSSIFDRLVAFTDVTLSTIPKSYSNASMRAFSKLVMFGCSVAFAMYPASVGGSTALQYSESATAALSLTIGAKSASAAADVRQIVFGSSTALKV